MTGKYGTLKITNSSGGQPSLELCHQWQCSASTCAGFVKLLYCRRKGAIKSCSGALQALSACADLHDHFFLEWSVLKWAAAIRPLFSPLLSLRHPTCLMVLCSMFQWASWTERKVGHWWTRRNRKTSDIHHYHLSYYRRCYSFALLEAGRRQRPGLLSCCRFGGSFAFQNKMQQFHRADNVKMICMNFT